MPCGRAAGPPVGPMRSEYGDPAARRSPWVPATPWRTSLRFVNWDRTTRNYKITPIPGNIEINEFDYKGLNEVVYDENGVVIRSYPAIHAGDGPVSYTLEYGGMKVVFGGDTVPNKWFPRIRPGCRRNSSTRP